MAELKLGTHTISIVSALGIAWGGAQAWEKWNETLRRIHDLEARVSAMAPQVPAPGNRWTCFDHRTFVYELQRRNPKLNVPFSSKECIP